MKLYYAPGACSLASHIALQETGLSFEIEKLNFSTKKTAGGDDFMQINPKGYVPTLKLNDGSILTEGPAILQYVADQKPESGLAPKAGTMDRYRLQEWLTFIGTELHKSYSPLFNPASSEELKTNARNMLTKRIAYVETQLTSKAYLVGDQFTVADAYLFVVLGWSGHVGFDLSPYPNIQQYLGKIGVRPGVQAALKAEGLIK
jgi:glutathione S-transferase